MSYPQWKVNLWRARHAHECSCREVWLPDSQSTRIKFDPDCPVHGDEETRAGRSIVENDAIQAERDTLTAEAIDA